MDVATILAELADLKTAVAAIPASVPAPDLQPISDAIADIKADVLAKSAPVVAG